MNLSACLRKIYPEAPIPSLMGDNPDDPWVIKDDGEGPFIANWNYHKPQPSLTQLKSAEILIVQQEVISRYTAGVQKHLDDFARTRNYDGILSASTYATSQVPKFQAEGQYAVTARDNTWAAAYELLAEVEAGTRPMPTLEEVIAALPELVWPQ